MQNKAIGKSLEILEKSGLLDVGQLKKDLKIMQCRAGDSETEAEKKVESIISNMRQVTLKFDPTGMLK